MTLGQGFHSFLQVSTALPAAGEPPRIAGTLACSIPPSVLPQVSGGKEAILVLTSKFSYLKNPVCFWLTGINRKKVHGYRKTTSEMHLAKMIQVFAIFQCLYQGFTNLQPKSLPGNIPHKLYQSSTKQICLAQGRD